MNDRLYDAKLENWLVSGDRLLGFIYEDTKNNFSDGVLITTEKIVKGDLIENSIVQTEDEVYYILGEKAAWA